MSHNVRKGTCGHVRPAKIQISLRIHSVRSEASLGAFLIAKDTKCLHAESEDSDQTVIMQRLIYVFAWRTCHKLRFITLRHIILRSFTGRILNRHKLNVRSKR